AIIRARTASADATTGLLAVAFPCVPLCSSVFPVVQAFNSQPQGTQRYTRGSFCIRPSQELPSGGLHRFPGALGHLLLGHVLLVSGDAPEMSKRILDEA